MDSPLAAWLPGLGHMKGKFASRKRPPVAIIIHTTGGGPLRRLTAPEHTRWRARNGAPKDTFEAAVALYRSTMVECAHYVVGQAPGQIAQVARETECAWHVGSKGSAPYAKRGWDTSDTAWWRTMWPEFETPRQLAGGHLWDPYGHPVGLRIAFEQWRGGGSVNANTIGIEVACPQPTPTAAWSTAAWANLAALVLDIGRRHVIPLDREFVLTHSDAHPRARSAKGRPWDPNSQQWSWARMAARLEAA